MVSDRTSEIATKYGVSWMDYAGNCRLMFPEYGIYVRRSGIENPFGKQLPKVLNFFSSKSSRVVRAMLKEPLRGCKIAGTNRSTDETPTCRTTLSKIVIYLIRDQLSLCGKIA